MFFQGKQGARSEDDGYCILMFGSVSHPYRIEASGANVPHNGGYGNSIKCSLTFSVAIELMQRDIARWSEIWNRNRSQENAGVRIVEVLILCGDDHRKE